MPGIFLNPHAPSPTFNLVTQDRPKFSPDPRTPNWSGAVLDPKFINAGMAVALLVNLAAIGLVHYDKVEPAGPFWSTTAPWRFLAAIVICWATMLLIRHSDRMVQWGARGFACGLPLALNSLLVLQRLPLFS